MAWQWRYAADPGASAHCRHRARVIRRDTGCAAACPISPSSTKGVAMRKAIVCGGSRRLDVVDGRDRARRRHAQARAEGAAACAGLQLDRLLCRHRRRLRPVQRRAGAGRGCAAPGHTDRHRLRRRVDAGRPGLAGHRAARLRCSIRRPVRWQLALRRVRGRGLGQYQGPPHRREPEHRSPTGEDKLRRAWAVGARLGWLVGSLL